MKITLEDFLSLPDLEAAQVLFEKGVSQFRIEQEPREHWAFLFRDIYNEEDHLKIFIDNDKA